MDKEEAKKQIKNLNKVDDTLTGYEDWMHGEDGTNCTKSRGLVHQVIEFLENLLK